jgi:mannose-1-phosphate guanylyltransferase
MIYAVIMAGGVGTRFWPRSRAAYPKQLLNIVGERTMIQQTADRIASLIAPENILIVTNERQAGGVRAQLPRIKNVLIEPVGRNTAPCIGLAALHIVRQDPDGVMAVLAADHLIQPAETFCETLEFAARVATETKSCVTLGIPPTRPETGYGYIQYLENDSLTLGHRRAHRVKTFAEKPNWQTAQQFIASGDFLWNSGMFIWQASTILSLIEEFLPDLHDGLMEIQSALGTDLYDETVRRVYRRIKGISIDYGVMERTKNVYVVKGDFEWNDVGSWEEAYQLSRKDQEGNALTGHSVLLNTTNSMIFSPKKTVAVIGMDNLIVVDTDDALLICPRDRAQDVKTIVEELQRQKKNELL